MASVSAPAPTVLGGVQVSVLLWPAGRISVEAIRYGYDLAEIDYDAADCPPDSLGEFGDRVAAAISRVANFAAEYGAGGKAGAQ